MRNLFVIFCVFSLLQCTAQRPMSYNANSNTIKDSLMFEKFDFDLDESKYAGYEYADDSYSNYGANGFYKLKNGGVFSADNYNGICWYYVIPPSPAFYSMEYIYFSNGNIKSKGQIAGFSSDIRIGKRKVYDEIGRLKEVDEDKKFGLWTFEKVLAKLDKDGVISLETGKNREYEKLNFFFDKDKKEWTVTVFKKEINVVTEEYWEYIFDGNTGKYTREWYERYNSTAERDMNLPPLKNSKKNKTQREITTYKTHQGKDYTQAEWKVFEQEQYNEHLRKTGRADLVKSIEKVDAPKTESTRESLFLADEEDVKPQKKKGFWGNFLAYSNNCLINRKYKYCTSQY